MFSSLFLFFFSHRKRKRDRKWSVDLFIIINDLNLLLPRIFLSLTRKTARDFSFHFGFHFSSVGEEERKTEKTGNRLIHFLHANSQKILVVSLCLRCVYNSIREQKVALAAAISSLSSPTSKKVQKLARQGRGWWAVRGYKHVGERERDLFSVCLWVDFRHEGDSRCEFCVVACCLPDVWPRCGPLSLPLFLFQLPPSSSSSSFAYRFSITPPLLPHSTPPSSYIHTQFNGTAVHREREGGRGFFIFLFILQIFWN